MGEVVETPAQQASGLSRYARGVWHHRSLLARSVVVLLVVIVVLQNLESTQVDVLLWSFVEVPKLVMMLASMLVGAVGWELGRRALASRRRSGPGT